MKVSVDITRKDLIRINFILWPRIRGNWLFVALIFGMCSLPMIEAWRVTEFDPLVVAKTLGISLALAFIIPGLTFLVCLGFVIASASTRTGLGEHAYEISADGIRETTALNSEFAKWASFEKAFKSKNYIFVKKHWAAIHIFPARHFESRQKFEDFFDALVRFVNRRPK